MNGNHHFVVWTSALALVVLPGSSAHSVLDWTFSPAAHQRAWTRGRSGSGDILWQTRLPLTGKWIPQPIPLLNNSWQQWPTWGRAPCKVSPSSKHNKQWPKGHLSVHGLQEGFVPRTREYRGSSLPLLLTSFSRFHEWVRGCNSK